MPTIYEALQIAIEHQQQGRFQDAESIYRQILLADPNQADANHLLGVLAHQCGRSEVAIQYISRAIALHAGEPSFHMNLGDALRAVQRHAEALAVYQQAIELRPDFVAVHDRIGNVLVDLEKFDEAKASFRRALEIEPNFPETLNNLGATLKAEGDLSGAEAYYRRAVEVRPNYAVALSNLGHVLCDQKRYDEAVVFCRRAIELQPDFAEAYSNLGLALYNRGAVDEGIDATRRALEINPQHVTSHFNLGKWLHDSQDTMEAIDCYRRALELNPHFADARSNLGNVFFDQGKMDESIQCFRQALKDAPDHESSQRNLAIALLLNGDLENGWREYERRWKKVDPSQRFSHRPRWDGSHLEGKTILIHCEQGFGDTLQFIRYLPLVRERGGRVVLQCQRPLRRLLRDFPVDQIITPDEPLPEFDVQASLLSLPGIFQTNFHNIPATIPYLFADPQLVEHWRQRLQRLDGFRIGICWQGSPTYGSDRFRSTQLKHFAALAAVPGVQLISLQKDVGLEQIAEAREQFPLVDFSDELDTAHGAFMDTAAIMMNLDLVVTIDSAIEHLAGALGVSVWIALSYVPDWRWFLQRTDSPFYPTVRLFRQPSLGDWPAVFSAMQTALLHEMSRKR